MLSERIRSLHSFSISLHKYNDVAIRVLNHCDANLARRIEGKDGAAAILGIHPSILRARMHKLGIVGPETKEPD